MPRSGNKDHSGKPADYVETVSCLLSANALSLSPENALVWGQLKGGSHVLISNPFKIKTSQPW